MGKYMLKKFRNKTEIIVFGLGKKKKNKYPCLEFPIQINLVK